MSSISTTKSWHREQIAYGSYNMKTKPDKVKKKKKIKKFHTTLIITKIIETCNFLFFFTLSQNWQTTTSNYTCIPIVPHQILQTHFFFPFNFGIFKN